MFIVLSSYFSLILFFLYFLKIIYYIPSFITANNLLSSVIHFLHPEINISYFISLHSYEIVCCYIFIFIYIFVCTFIYLFIDLFVRLFSLHQAELSRQRDTNVSLRNSMAANETEQKLKLHELETAKLK